MRVGNENPSVVRDGRVSTSNRVAVPAIMHGSSLSDDSSRHSDSGIMNDGVGNGVVNHSRPKSLYNAMYSQCVLSMSTLAKDPSLRIASLGRRVLSVIGIEQVVTRPSNSASNSFRPGETTAAPTTTSLAGPARSSSWFDMNAGHLPLTFRTPSVGPPQPSHLIRRVWSLEFRRHLMNSADWGLADPLLGSGGSSGLSGRSLLPQLTIYNWSCAHFSKPLLTAADGSAEILTRREEREKISLEHILKSQHASINKLNNQIAVWDTKFEAGSKAAVMQPFTPIVIAADENERIRVWNYKEAASLNSFDNHDYPEKGVSKLCLLNELDESLLLVASCDGNIRVWKDYSLKGKQKLVTAFSSIQGHNPGVRSVNAVVEWQQQSGYLYASGELSSIMVWDLDKEQLAHSITSASECSLSALSASQVHGGQFAAGFVDGSVRLYDVRTPEMLVCATQPHTQKVEKVVGIGFQPGLDPAKIVSASQAGDIQLLDLRNKRDAYLTFTAEVPRGSLSALAVHRHAPIIATASGSAKQLIEVFSLEGDQLGTIKHSSTFVAQKIGSVSCLAFHPYQIRLAVGAADSCLSIYADDSSQAR